MKMKKSKVNHFSIDSETQVSLQHVCQHQTHSVLDLNMLLQQTEMTVGIIAHFCKTQG